MSRFLLQDLLGDVADGVAKAAADVVVAEAAAHVVITVAVKGVDVDVVEVLVACLLTDTLETAVATITGG